MPLFLTIPIAFVLAMLLSSPIAQPEIPIAVDHDALSADDERFSGSIDADQEVADPPVDSNAHGHVKVVVDDAADTIEVQAVVTNLSGPAAGAHLHLGAAGTNGPVVVDLTSGITQQTDHVIKIQATLSASAVVGPLETEPDRIAALLRELSDGNIYFNVHTDAYPAGEARGQL